MVLNDKWIKDNSWIVDPFDECMVNPNSLDLRWSGRYRRPNPDKNYRTVRTWEKEELTDLWDSVREVNELCIHPGQFVLLDTLEKIQIPQNMVGLLMLKSSIGRLGIEHHHAGFFDSGFGLGNPSTGTLEITNTAPWICVIRKGQPIVQMVFIQSDEPERDYRITGRYNGQITPTGAK